MWRVACGAFVLGCCSLLASCLAQTPSSVAMTIVPSSGYTPLLVQLQAHYRESDLDAVRFEWLLGDDVTAVGAVVEHEFTGVGPVPITLVATDVTGKATTSSGQVLLLNRLPHAHFTIQPNPPATQLPIHFDASASDDQDGVIVSYHWDFGDGESAEGITVQHAFLIPHQVYRVVLTVTDDLGDTNSMYRDIEPIGCDH